MQLLQGQPKWLPFLLLVMTLVDSEVFISPPFYPYVQALWFLDYWHDLFTSDSGTYVRVAVRARRFGRRLY